LALIPQTSTRWPHCSIDVIGMRRHRRWGSALHLTGADRLTLAGHQ
jgi:hypothetical protein